MSTSIHNIPEPMKLIAIGFTAWDGRTPDLSQSHKTIAREALRALLDQARKRGFRDTSKFIARLKGGKGTPKLIEEAQVICRHLGPQVVSDALTEMCHKQTAALVREEQGGEDGPDAGLPTLTEP